MLEVKTKLTVSLKPLIGYRAFVIISVKGIFRFSLILKRLESLPVLSRCLNSELR